MSIGTIVCSIMAALFLLLAIIFAMLKEKGAVLISGFNSLPKDERKQYDQLKMSEDMRNTLFVWFFLFAVGGVLTSIFSVTFTILAFVVWLVLFFKEVHFDTETAFHKYKL